jgi:GNAT superfamily N-acetyltransferase
MPTVTFHKSVAEFMTVHEEFLERHYYLVYPLLELIRNAKKNNLKVSAAFSFQEADCLAVGIQAGPYLALYATEWNEPLLSLIEQTMPLQKMGGNIFFSGTYDLISALLSRSGKEFKEISARNVYECKRLAPGIILSDGACIRADVSDMDRIADLSFGFQQDEYGDRAQHDREYMLTHVVEPGIINGSIVKWEVDDEVVSIAQVMIDEENKPIIGHFFTDPGYRGRGYGTSLIWSVTNAILKDFEICGLVTKLTNTAANAIFRKVGYELKYHWLKASFVGK